MTLDLAVAPESAQDLILALEPGTTLAGRVLDPEDRPVPWAAVSAYPARTHADAEGRFELEDVPASARRLFVTAPGFAALEQPLGAGPAELVLRLAPSARLAGRVIDAETGAPIPHVTLRLLDPADLSSHASWSPWTEGLVSADPTGIWQLEASFPAGLSAALEARAEGYAPALAERVESSLAPDPEACVLRLVRATRLSGVVVDAESGAPIEGATVWSSTRPFPTSAHPWAHTDVHGRFELLDLPTGTTSLHVRRLGHADVVDGPFRLEGALERRIELGHGATSSGRLLAPDGEALAAEPVTLARVDERGQLFRWGTVTDAEGRFVFRNLPAGEHRLAWKRSVPVDEAPAMGPARSGLGSLGYAEDLPTGARLVSLDLVDTLTLAEHETRTVVLQARGHTVLTGTLAGAGPVPQSVAVSLVRLDPAGQPTPQARGAIAEGGVFRFTHLEPGPYELRAELVLGPGRTATGRIALEIPAQGETSAHLELEAPR